jgi:hypothetical protein
LEKNGASPEDVARVIYRAATSRGGKFRYPAGRDAHLVLALRSMLPFRIFSAVFRRAVGG